MRNDRRLTFVLGLVVLAGLAALGAGLFGFRPRRSVLPTPSPTPEVKKLSPSILMEHGFSPRQDAPEIYENPRISLGELRKVVGFELRDLRSVPSGPPIPGDREEAVNTNGVRCVIKYLPPVPKREPSDLSFVRANIELGLASNNALAALISRLRRRAR